MRARTPLVLFLAAALASPCSADGIQWRKSPIKTRDSLFDGMSYSLAGQKLETFQDLSDVLTPLNDAEADRLLAQSEDSALWGSWGRTLGTLGVGAGGFGLLFDDSPSSHSTHWTFLLAGIGVDLLSSLFLADSQSAKYNAVERYNDLVRGEDDSLPQAPADGKDLLPKTR